MSVWQGLGRVWEDRCVCEGIQEDTGLFCVLIDVALTSIYARDQTGGTRHVAAMCQFPGFDVALWLSVTTPGPGCLYTGPLCTTVQLPVHL